MSNIFEVTDITTRKIRLTKEQWQHIKEEHNDVNNIEEMVQTLQLPDKVEKRKEYRHEVGKYYKYNKERRKMLFIAVRYLNGKGFIITAYYRKK